MRWGMYGMMSFGDHHFSGHRRRKYKTIIKTKNDNIRMIQTRVKAAFVQLGGVYDMREINTLAQQCMKHGSVDVTL